MTAYEFEIVRQPLRADAIVLRSPFASAGELVLHAPSLRRVDFVAEACAAVRGYLSARAVPIEWLSVVERMLQPYGASWSVSVEELRSVIIGFDALSRAARPPPRGACPDELVEAWGLLATFWAQGLSLIDQARVASAGEATIAVQSARDSLPHDAERGLRRTPDATWILASAFGRAEPAWEKRCSCGTAFDLLLRFERTALSRIDPSFASFEHDVVCLYCRACDIEWCDPELRYRVREGNLELLQRPAGCRRVRTPRELRACDVGVRENDEPRSPWRLGPPAPPEVDRPERNCSSCAEAMRFVASMPADPEIGLLIDAGHWLTFWACARCGETLASVAITDSAGAE